MRSIPLVALVLLAACGAAQASPALPIELPAALAPAATPSAPPEVDDLFETLAVPDVVEDPLAPAAPAAPPALDAPALAATAAGGTMLLLAGFALYSRLARSELLDHERRDAVQKLVKGSPGIPLTDIAQRLGLAWGVAVYHLDRLEKGGFVTSEKVSGRRCFFPVGSVPRESRAGLGALQQGTTRDVAAFVAARPGATQSELCEGLGLSASAASKQVSKLESVGLVRREREWKTVKLHPEPQLVAIMTA